MARAVAAGILAASAWFLSAIVLQCRGRLYLLVRAGGADRLARTLMPGHRAVAILRRPWLLRWLAAAAGLWLGSLVAGTPGALAGMAAPLALPEVVRRRRAARLEEQMEAQLAEAVATACAGLRAGLSLLQALRLAADEGEPPLAPTLREVVDRTGMGMPLGTSLDRWASSVGKGDARLVAGVMKLHLRTGGDLPRVLDQLSRTLRDRRAAEREVRSLTAQARLSGAILGFLPVGFFLFLSVTSREDIAAAFRSPAGSTAISLGLVLQLVAFLWIRRLLRVTM